ncbi:MAG TPA: MBL fold metallo-hydrolase [Burkholderiales bacterium]|jgi:glyoxylase-like metal-dependent hydrolase (beta-lactamase superfamily II)|nr:MBL fold metallo-hydrolase [Burkholderiales bacterium]
MSAQAISSLTYPFPEVPAPGTTIEVAPGIRWLSMPLPFKLDHINLWLVEEEGGWTVVDTGIGNPETRALWEQILGQGHVKRVILTHYHPDHAGNAAWLCERYGAELWTTQGEYLTAHAVRTAGAGYTPDAVLAVFRKNGLDDERAARMRSSRNRYAELVPGFPHSYRRIIEGDEVPMGGRRWRAIVGHGHAPEHLSLFSKELNTVIAGDMLLSTISTNVSVWSIDPEGDPLRLFLDSIARYRGLPADVLVLPSHGKPFRGAHRRIGELEQHHRERLEELSQCLHSPKSAAELLGVLFRRPLDAHQTFFAMGEAIAHLHYLYYAGRAERAMGHDGIMRYAIRP